jgi:hypothetical protein
MHAHFKRAFVFFLLSTAVSICSAQKTREAVPSYQDTLHYIQERLDGGLEEVDHCRFVYHDSGDQTFDATSLSPHLSWEDKHEASINCTGGKRCVEYSGSDKPRDFWIFRTKTDTNRDKIEKAILHLLNQCGVRPAKPDLF